MRAMRCAPVPCIVAHLPERQGPYLLQARGRGKYSWLGLAAGWGGGSGVAGGRQVGGPPAQDESEPGHTVLRSAGAGKAVALAGEHEELCGPAAALEPHEPPLP